MFRLVAFAAACCLAAEALEPTEARADGWFFGLFGGDKPPTPMPTTLPYTVMFEAGDSKLTDLLQDASDVYRLRQEPPPNGQALAQRVASDLPHLVDALWSEGYYDAAVRAFVAERMLAVDGVGLDAAAASADALRNRALVPIRIEAAPGPLYKLRAVTVLDSGTQRPLPPDLMVRRLGDFDSGQPARATAVREAQTRIVDHLRDLSYPLAKIVSTTPVVVHPDRVVDVTIAVDPGPRAGIGPVTITGAPDLDPAVPRSFVYLREGEDYSPAKLAATRKSLTTVEAIGGVKITEADHLDASGNLPLFIDLSERQPYAVSASAQYSTIDGPSVRTAFTARNLFGGGERLRLEATAGFLNDRGGDLTSHKLLDPFHLLGRVGASFIKPALWGSRNDLLLDVFAVRELTDDYRAKYLTVNSAIRHRFNESTYVQAGLEVERGRSADILGTTDYTLVGIPLIAQYDTTDNLLNPTRGVRVLGTFSGYAKAVGSSTNLLQAKVQGSTYFSLDEDSRYILAGRLAVGSLSGATLTDIPDNRRFFAGGGGSVRGYAYRSLAPTGPYGFAIGGRSLLEGSLEARLRVTDTIGVVPFVDAGNAFASSYPDFRNKIRVGAGLGLRYYTGFGPIRVDVAVPLNRQKGDPRVALYISVGQAF